MSMLPFLDIPLDLGGSGGCRRCHRHVDVEIVRRSAAEIEAELDAAISAAPGSGIMFTGLDALGHSAFLDLAARATRAGVARIGVRTTGSPLADPETTTTLIAGGIRLFEVPFLGSGPERHDALSGVPGSFDLAVRGVRAVFEAAESRAARVAVRARVGVCRHTVHDLPATVMRLAELRVTSITLDCGSDAGAARFAKWVIAACDTGTVNRIWVSVSGLDAALLGDRALHGVDVVGSSGVNR